MQPCYEQDMSMPPLVFPWLALSHQKRGATDTEFGATRQTDRHKYIGTTAALNYTQRNVFGMHFFYERMYYFLLISVNVFFL